MNSLFSLNSPSLIDQKSGVLNSSDEILEQGFQALEEILKPIKDQINEISQSVEERKIPYDQISELSQSVEELKLIAAKLNKPSELPNNNEEYNLDLSFKLSDFVQKVIDEFNQKKIDFLRTYSTHSKLITISITGESFGNSYKPITISSEEISEKWAKNIYPIYLQEDSKGIFWAIKDQDSDNYLLVLNQQRLTPKQLKNTFEFSLKHIDQIFDGGKEFDKNMHTGIKIISPAIAVNNQVKDGEILELKVKGELEFY